MSTMTKRTRYTILAIASAIIFIAVLWLVLYQTNVARQAPSVPVAKQPSSEESVVKREPPWGGGAVNTSNNGISVRAPMPYADIASPVIVAGNAVAFENTVSIIIRDAGGRVVGRGFATALASDVGQSGPYRTAVAFNAPAGAKLFVEVFEASAKDGTPIHMVRIPVRVTDNVTVYSVFLAKESGGAGCPLTSAVRRSVPATTAVARAALEHLFAGPTREEWENGYRSFVPQETKINQLTVEAGVATADFSAYQIPAGVCAADTARVQIEKTLLQFQMVTSVTLSVNGDTEVFLQSVR